MPDSLREREPLKRGPAPRTELSKGLLEGGTFEIQGTKNFGSLYTLAKNHNKRARTQKQIINGKEVTVVWFEDKDDEDGQSNP